MLSAQTGIIGSLLQELGFPNVSEHLGVKQLVIFGICLGVTLDLAGKLLNQGRRFLLTSFRGSTRNSQG